MITQDQIYWLTRCDEIRHLLSSIACLATVAMILSALAALVMGVAAKFSGNGTYDLFSELSKEGLEEMHASLWKGCRRAIFMAVAFAVFSGMVDAAKVLTPTTKEMAAIVVIPRVANSEAVGDIGEGIVTLAKEWLEELRPKVRTAKPESPSVPAKGAGK